MHEEGLRQVGGRIVLDRFSLLHDGQSGQAATTVAEAAPGNGPPDPQSYTLGASVVVVQPSKGELAEVSLQPRMAGVVIINEMLMGGTSPTVCGARVRWEDPTEASPGTLVLLVSGRWINDCGRREVAFVKPPTAGATALVVNAPRLGAATPADAPGSAVRSGKKAPPPHAVSPSGMVASLWAESGGQLRGGVVETARSRQSSVGARADDAGPREGRDWSSRTVTSMPGLLREMNKTSNNVAARDLLLSLGPPGPMAQRAAQRRVAEWLRSQGLADDDLRIDDGSGRSRLARGRPRALVQLLVNEWRSKDARVFVDSLPIAGVDGTLSRRMRGGAAAGRAFLKTGSLSDTRALAGYVTARSGKVYAIALLVNHTQAARATPALDALVEWLAANG
jgi:D-alanyl-D-alanine carboxypeptidase/D-alanyl-D-alanine-endopeptidase (penicillin-binding protein 4)